MNLSLRGISHNLGEISDSTFLNDLHKGMYFDAIVANPPFSAKWSADKSFMDDSRFSAYGKLAPKSKADYAFVQHMILPLNENGTMAIVLPHGVLFRGASEGKIREYLVGEKNYLDAVIGLPANLFYGTSILLVYLYLRNVGSMMMKFYS
jgi:type I restriction enzyme M protein